MKVNIEIDVISKLAEELGNNNALRLLSMYQNMAYDNSVNLESLWLSMSATTKLRAKLSKLGYIKRIKLSDKKWIKWYLNPLYANKNHVDVKIWELFNINPTNYER